MSENKPNPVKFASEYKEGIDSGRPNLYQALKAAGYSETVAKRGKAALSGPLIEALLREGIEYAKIGERLEPATVENAIAGKLFTNLLTGESRGNDTAKLLGSMVKFGAFKSDTNTNMIVLADIPAHMQAPESVLEASQPTQISTADVE